jgi:hypothetical protein
MRGLKYVPSLVLLVYRRLQIFEQSRPVEAHSLPLLSILQPFMMDADSGARFGGDHSNLKG